MPRAPDDISVELVMAKDNYFIIGLYIGTVKELTDMFDPVLKLGKSRLEVQQCTFMESVLHFAPLGSIEEGMKQLTQKSHGKLIVKSSVVKQPISLECMDVMIEHIRNAPDGTTGFKIQFFAYGGAISKIASRDTAFYHRDGLFSLQFLLRWDEGDKESLQWVRKFYNHVVEYVGPCAYANYGDGDVKDYGRAYYGDNWDRLIDIKTKYDPHNFFNYEQSVPVRGQYNVSKF